MPIEITAEERQELRNLRRSSPKKRNWVRADIILRVAEGQTNYMIAKQLGLSRNTVQHWRYRFARERLNGLQTRPIPGRPKKVIALNAWPMVHAVCTDGLPANADEGHEIS